MSESSNGLELIKQALVIGEKNYKHPKQKLWLDENESKVFSADILRNCVEDMPLYNENYQAIDFIQIIRDEVTRKYSISLTHAYISLGHKNEERKYFIEAIKDYDLTKDGILCEELKQYLLKSNTRLVIRNGAVNKYFIWLDIDALLEKNIPEEQLKKLKGNDNRIKPFTNHDRYFYANPYSRYVCKLRNNLLLGNFYFNTQFDINEIRDSLATLTYCLVDVPISETNLLGVVFFAKCRAYKKTKLENVLMYLMQGE